MEHVGHSPREECNDKQRECENIAKCATKDNHACEAEFRASAFAAHVSEDGQVPRESPCPRETDEEEDDCKNVDDKLENENDEVYDEVDDDGAH